MIVLLLGAATVYAQEGKITPTVDVNASTDSLVAPDMFYLTITITDQQGAGKAGLDNTEKTKLLPTLKDFGVDVQKDVTVTSTQSTFEKKKVIAMSRTYQVILRDGAKVNPLISTLADAGIGNAYLSKVAIENSDSIQNALKVAAMQKAKADAAVLAGAVGQKIGEAVKISYYGGSNGGVRPIYMMAKAATGAMMDSAESAPQSVDQFQKIELRASVQVSFLLLPGVHDRMMHPGE